MVVSGRGVWWSVGGVGGGQWAGCVVVSGRGVWWSVGGVCGGQWAGCVVVRPGRGGAHAVMQWPGMDGAGPAGLVVSCPA